MLLKDLFESNLFENLGNLNFLDKKWNKELTDVFEYTTGFQGIQIRHSSELLKHIGQNSEIKSTKISSGKSLVTLLEEDTFGAGVIIINGIQLVLIKKHYLNGKNMFSIIVDEKELNAIVPDWSNILIDKGVSVSGSYSILDLKSRPVIKNANAAITPLITLLKTYSKDIILQYAEVDTKRIEKSEQRELSKTVDPESKIVLQRNPGSNVLQKDFNYLDKVKTQLQSRLDDYRKSKAPKTKNIDEFIEALKEQGFLQIIYYKGIPYKLDRFKNFELSNFLQKELKEPHIQYYLDDRSSEWKALNKKIMISREMFDDYKEFEEMKNKMLPPRYLNIFMKLEKSSIIVDKVEGSKNSL